MSTESRLRTEKRTRLGLIHGFTQTSSCWGEFGRLLAASSRLVPIDAPGHGSGSDVNDLWEAGAATARQLGGGALLGYSMGGRIALHAALSKAGIERLVLISATGGLDTAGERAARRRADEALADRIEMIGVDAFVDEWLASPMFARLPVDLDCLAARRANTTAGLAMSLRTCGTGTQQPLWERLGELDVPVLVIAGADDTKFAGLGRRLAESLPHGELAVIAGAGHACHSERPHDVAAVIDRWLTSSGNRSSAPPR